MCASVSACTFFDAVSFTPIFVSVPQVLALMVDLEDEKDWSVQDDQEDEDTDRYTKVLSLSVSLSPFLSISLSLTMSLSLSL